MAIKQAILGKKKQTFNHSRTKVESQIENHQLIRRSLALTNGYTIKTLFYPLSFPDYGRFYGNNDDLNDLAKHFCDGQVTPHDLSLILQFVSCALSLPVFRMIIPTFLKLG